MYDLEQWKRRKKELNLTLNDIAEKTGIGISTIKDIFRGETYAPRIDTVQAIESVLGLTQESDNASYRPQAYNLTNLEKSMLELFREIGTKHGQQAQGRAIEIVKLAFSEAANKN